MEFRQTETCTYKIEIGVTAIVINFQHESAKSFRLNLCMALAFDLQFIHCVYNIEISAYA